MLLKLFFLLRNVPHHIVLNTTVSWIQPIYLYRIALLVIRRKWNALEGSIREISKLWWLHTRSKVCNYYKEGKCTQKAKSFITPQNPKDVFVVEIVVAVQLWPSDLHQRNDIFISGQEGKDLAIVIEGEHKSVSNT